jgi:ankyrin repeat protein
MEFKILVQKQEILEDFMNFDCVDKSGYTLLSYAIEGGNLETIRFLILCGAKTYSQDDEVIH